MCSEILGILHQKSDKIISKIISWAKVNEIYRFKVNKVDSNGRQIKIKQKQSKIKMKSEMNVESKVKWKVNKKFYQK